LALGPAGRSAARRYRAKSWPFPGTTHGFLNGREMRRAGVQLLPNPLPGVLLFLGGLLRTVGENDADQGACRKINGLTGHEDLTVKSSFDRRHARWPPQRDWRIVSEVLMITAGARECHAGFVLAIA